MTTKQYNNLKFSKEGHIGTITLSRPKALNALNTELLLELKDIVNAISTDETIHVLIITGEGKAFVAGADITEMKNFNSTDGLKYGELGATVLRNIQKLKIPSIAAVNGFALGGGCELAMCCDLRIASENAKFGQPEINLGIIPGIGGTQNLTKLIGVAKAKELIFSGNIIDAQTALSMGLVNSVVPHDQLLAEAKSFAQKLLSKSSITLALAKKAINAGLSMDLTPVLT